MTKQIIWTKAVVEAFIEEGNLNSRQEYIIRTRAKGLSIVEQAEHLNLSVDQVNKDIATLKKIYDITQKYSEILPERKKNKKELFK
jgi:DNA-binding CsgD family transcriptional regulator